MEDWIAWESIDHYCPPRPRRNFRSRQLINVTGFQPNWI